MSQTRSGTVTVTNGSPTVTGSGTKWLTGTPKVTAGSIFTVAGSGVPYIVAADATSDTSITLTSNYGGVNASGQNYAITTSFTPNRDLPYPDFGDVDTPTTLKRAMLTLDTLLGAAFTAGRVVYTDANGNMLTGSLAYDGTTLSGAAGSFTALSASGHVTFENVTSTGATGTGKLVFSISPTLTGTTNSGPITVNGTAATNQAALTSTGNTTGSSYINLTNTGNQIQVGIESSAGGFLVTGSGAYEAAISTNNKALNFSTNNGASRQMILGVTGGLQIGIPTGGDKGSGTLNVAADVYLNGTAYTNPDYVLEHWATGKIEKFTAKAGAKEYGGLMPLADVELFAREHFHLPRFGQRAGHGLFGGSDAMLASVEEVYLYLFDHERRLAKITAALQGSGIIIQ